MFFAMCYIRHDSINGKRDIVRYIKKNGNIILFPVNVVTKYRYENLTQLNLSQNTVFWGCLCFWQRAIYVMTGETERETKCVILKKNWEHLFIPN